MTEATVAITAYPLSAAYKARLEAKFRSGPIEFRSLRELTRLGVLGILRSLWSIKASQLLVPIEDQASQAILPVLICVAVCTRAGRITLVRPDLSTVRVARWHLVTSAFGLSYASAALIIAAARAKIEIRRLLRTPRTEMGWGTFKNLAYLKTNMWFGVKVGGSIGHIAGVVNGFAGSGFKVKYFSAEEPVLLGPSVECGRIEAPRNFGLPFELNHFRFQRQFIGQIQDSLDGVDFIYQRLSIANYSGVVLSRALRRPLVIEYNGSETWVAKNWGRPLRHHALAEDAEKVCLQHAAAVVTISQVLADELVGRGVDKDRVIFYPNCIDPVMFNPDRFTAAQATEVKRSLRLPADTKLVTFVGTFGQWHGVDILAEATKAFIVNDRAWLEEQKVHFLLIGDGMLMPRVREILGYHLDERRFCTCTGLIAQEVLPSYLAASSVLVSPHIPNRDGSRFFGSPTKLFEYMAMERPIVASRLEQIAEVLSDSTALLVEPGHVEQLRAGIRTAIDDAQLARRLAINARREALARFTWKHHVQVIIDRLQRLGAGKPC